MTDEPRLCRLIRYCTFPIAAAGWCLGTLAAKVGDKVAGPVDRYLRQTYGI